MNGHTSPVCPGLLKFVLVSTTVLALSPNSFAQWNEEVLYSFQSIPDGSGPIGRIVHDKQGNLYGATIDGGAANCLSPGQCGTVYELSPPAKKDDPWIETILHTFQGPQDGDGATPEGGLVIDDAGNLYGTTGYDGTGQCKLLGGVVGCGTVYELSPPSQPGGAWTETVIYSFQGGNDGFVATGDLVFDKAGNLYGATLFGGGRGTTCDYLYGGNCGTIFELSPPKKKGGAWTEQVLYSFAGVEPWSIVGDGGQPNGGLVLDEKGNLYGTTFYGGADTGICHGSTTFGCGIVFELVRPSKSGAPWMENVLHHFLAQPTDGAIPNGNLVPYARTLLGTTRGGGTYEDGVVFQVEPPIDGGTEWSENLVHEFDGTDGTGPGSLVLGSNDTFYGAATGGSSPGGLVFQLQPSDHYGETWGFATDYAFPGVPNAYDPQDLSLVSRSGEMYGSSMYGGASQNCGLSGCGTVWAAWP